MFKNPHSKKTTLTCIYAMTAKRLMAKRTMPQRKYTAPCSKSDMPIRERPSVARAAPSKMDLRLPSLGMTHLTQPWMKAGTTLRNKIKDVSLC